MRISDWSSDVCSSDLGCRGFLDLGERGGHIAAAGGARRVGGGADDDEVVVHHVGAADAVALGDERLFRRLGMHEEHAAVAVQIGRASCRERVCKYVEIWVVAG